MKEAFGNISSLAYIPLSTKTAESILRKEILILSVSSQDQDYKKGIHTFTLTEI